MTRASNPIHYRTDADRVAAAVADGRCPVCGGFVRSVVGCLHTALRHMMTDAEYKRRNVDEMTFDQLRDLRLELVNALPTETRSKDEAIRIPTDRLDTTWTARKGA